MQLITNTTFSVCLFVFFLHFVFYFNKFHFGSQKISHTQQKHTHTHTKKREQKQTNIQIQTQNCKHSKCKISTLSQKKNM